MTDKELISKICKLLYHSISKKQTTPAKNGQKERGQDGENKNVLLLQGIHTICEVLLDCGLGLVVNVYCKLSATTNQDKEV